MDTKLEPAGPGRVSDPRPCGRRHDGSRACPRLARTTARRASTTGSWAGRRTRARLSKARAALARERERARLLAEQVAHIDGVADDAETRAVVDPNPSTRREAHAATQDRERHARQLAEATARVERLETELDALLDRLTTSPDPHKDRR